MSKHLTLDQAVVKSLLAITSVTGGTIIAEDAVKELIEHTQAVVDSIKAHNTDTISRQQFLNMVDYSKHFNSLIDESQIPVALSEEEIRTLKEAQTLLNDSNLINSYGLTRPSIQTFDPRKVEK